MNCDNNYLSNYANVLGKPGEGFHKHVAGMAIGDIIATGIVAYGLSYYTDKSFIVMFIILFVIGTLLHIAFCVPTQFIKLLKSIEPIVLGNK